MWSFIDDYFSFSFFMPCGGMMANLNIRRALSLVEDKEEGDEGSSNFTPLHGGTFSYRQCQYIPTS